MTRTLPHRLAAALVLAMAAAPVASVGAQNRFVQTNLVSDIAGLATFTDASLVNPWGIATSPTSPFWVSDNGTGLSTLYNTTGTKLGLVVTVPSGGTAPSKPTGVTFNNTGAFAVAPGSNAAFLFATENGTIAGWAGALGTNAVTVVDRSASGAAYKGIAVAGRGGEARLFAANFAAGTVDAWDSGFAPILPGAFVDAAVPTGYAPFNVQNFGGSLYVTYALRGPNGDDVAGAGHGFIDVFDTNGKLLRRLANGGVLNSPWGMAVAPVGFGGFAGDLLVGNFGDGTINAFDPLTGALNGTLRGLGGSALRIQGLWGLIAGNGGNGGVPSSIYFAAGIAGDGGQVEDHGLFGSLAFVATPEPGSFALLATGLLLGVAGVVRRRSQR
jgi:uncharacterized protein (TIGR03118 family)